jgi:hypothetical protein
MSYEEDLEDYDYCVRTDLDRYDDFEEDDTVGEFENDSFDDSMDGDAESALSSAGHGTDESYGYYGEDLDYQEDFHSDEAVGFIDYNDDGPYWD